MLAVARPFLLGVCVVGVWVRGRGDFHAVLLASVHRCVSQLQHEARDFAKCCVFQEKIKKKESSVSPVSLLNTCTLPH